MAKYAVPFTKGADNKQQIVDMIADATRPRRGKLYDYKVGCTTAADDGVTTYELRRVTGGATGTTVTVVPLDPADAATELDAKNIITTDAASFAAGTLLDEFPMNNRATYRWVAAPGGELVYPATASNGLSLGASAVTTKLYAGGAHVEEQ